MEKRITGHTELLGLIATPIRHSKYMESGDVVLVGGSIAALATAVKLSRATMRKIKQNLFWAFFSNVIGIPVAAFGLLSPVIAGAAMAFSSVSVVTNSMLLKRTKIE